MSHGRFAHVFLADNTRAHTPTLPHDRRERHDPVSQLNGSAVLNRQFGRDRRSQFVQIEKMHASEQAFQVLSRKRVV